MAACPKSDNAPSVEWFSITEVAEGSTLGYGESVKFGRAKKA